MTNSVKATAPDKEKSSLNAGIQSNYKNKPYSFFNAPLRGSKSQVERDKVEGGCDGIYFYLFTPWPPQTTTAGIQESKMPKYGMCSAFQAKSVDASSHRRFLLKFKVQFS